MGGFSNVPGAGGLPAAHDLGGAEHNADTLANLNTKVSDATLIDTADSRLSDARTPTAHALGGAEHSADTLANLNSKISDATLSDYSGFTSGSLVFANGSGLAQDNANLSWDDTNNRFGIGTPTPLAPLELVGDSPGTVGGFFSGALHVRSPSVLVNANAVITGHNSFGGNKQLWYVGSASSSNDNVIFFNRQNADLGLGTDSAQRVTIKGSGDVGIGTTIPNQKLTVEGTMDLLEQAAANADTAAYGQIWVKSTTPNRLMFTDDAGTDFEISQGAARSVHFEPKGDPITSPSAVTLGVLRAFELPDAATKAVVWAIHLPEDLDLSVNPTIHVHFSPSVAGAGNANVRFQLECRYVSVGEQIDKAVDETKLQTKAVIDVVEEMHEEIITLDASLIAAGDYLVFVLTRLGPDGADNYTGNIGVYEDQGALVYTAKS